MISARITSWKTAPARRASWRCTLFRTLLAAALALSAAAVVHAQTVASGEAAASQKAERPVAYRRIFVPADHVDAWPRAGEKFLPIEAREFDELVAAANQTAQRRAHGVITRAEYSGRLQEDGRIVGHGQWTVELRGNQPAFLPLADMSLIVRKPRWRDDANRPARLGVWAPSDAGNQYGLEVPRSGVLEFDWHVAVREQQENLEAWWRLPNATRTQLTLELPAGKQPLLDGGVVLDARPLPDDDGDGKRSRRWQLRLNPTSAALLRIVEAGRLPLQRSPTLALRDEVAYQATERGLKIVTTWHFDESIADNRELIVPVPQGVQLLSAVAAGEKLSWRIVDGGDAAATRVLIELPKSRPQRGLTITLEAWHPLVTGTSWQLPSLRPQGVFWTSGNTELSVAPTLELARLVPSGCVQTGVRHDAPAGSGSATCSFAAYSPDARLELSLAARQPQFEVRIGTSLVFAEQDVSGRLAAQFDVTRGELHALSASVTSGWILDAVETIPADALGEWFVDRRRGRRELQIQLAQSANAERQVTVVLKGHREPARVANRYSLDALAMVEWRGGSVAKRLLTFHAMEPYIAEPSGNLPVVDPQALSENMHQLLDLAQGEAQVYDVTQAERAVAMRVAMKRVEFDAEIQLDASDDGRQLQQVHRIVVQPRAGRIDRLLVFATEPLAGDARWVEAGSNMPLSAEPLAADDPRRAGFPEGGQLWLLRLPQPSAAPVEILNLQTTQSSEPKRLPLLSTPEAIQQRGRVLVRGEAGQMPLLEPKAMPPIPVPMESADARRPEGTPPVRFAYRYEPADCQHPARQPSLSFDRSAPAGSKSVVASRAELESFFLPSGRAFHRATYYLQNDGADEFRLSLPAGARSTTVTLDGRAVERPPAPEATGSILIPLPGNRRSSVIAVQFEARQLPLTTGTKLPPPLVTEDLPILTGHWRVWLPAEFAATGLEANRLGDGFNWRRRLFGPLGRPNDARPFHPLRSEDWRWPASEVADASTNSVNGGSAAGLQQERSADQQKPGAAGEIVQVAHLEERAAAAPPMQTRPIAQASPAGWRLYETSFVGEMPPPVVIASPAASTAWSVAAFLLCLVAGKSVRRRRRNLFVLLVAIAAGSSLLLPITFSPPATGALLGLILSPFVELRRFRVTEESPTQTWDRRATVAFLAAAFLTALGSASVGQSTENAPAPESSISITKPEAAEEAAPNKSERPGEVHRVLIPTEADLTPSGSKYYVSEPFLRHLLRASESQSVANRQWVLFDAAYTGELRERAQPAGVVAGRWTLTFELEAPARDTAVVLPLVHDEAEWSGTATLDGVPVKIEWNEGGRGCRVEVAEPGRYQLAISCVPRTNETGRDARVQLTIPPIPGAAIRVSYPRDLDGLEVPTATTVRQDSATAGQLAAELDGSDQLLLSWPLSESSPEAAQGLRVHHLRWLRIELDDVELETKYIIDGGVRRPDTLAIVFDDRWRLLEGSPAVNHRVETDSQGRRVVRVSLSPGDVDRQEVHLRWKLKGAQTLGRLRLPSIELASVPEIQRWLAVSNDPRLKCEMLSGAMVTSGTANEFLAMWGASSADNQSLNVFTNIESSTEWTLAVEPRSSESKIDQVIHVAAGGGGLRVEYLADIAPSQSEEFQFPLTASAELTIDEVVVTQGGAQVPVRWTRPTENAVNVFFAQRTADAYRLTVRGHVPARARGAYALPTVSAASSPTAVQTQFYREPDVLLEVDGLGEVGALDDNALDPSPTQWGARLTSGYQLGPPAFESVRLFVTPNRMQTAGQSLTTLTYEPDGWWATFSCQLTVERGQLDSLRLRAPASWSGPFEIHSDDPVAVERIGVAPEQATFVVRPAKPIGPGQTFKLALRGPLAAAGTLPVSVPQIEPESGSRWRRYIVVPTAIDGKPIAWNEIGVRPAELPHEFAVAGPYTKAVRSLEVAATAFDVASRPAAAFAPEASVRLADTLVTSGPRGGQLIVTRLVFVSHGLTECVLEVPDDQALVSVHLEGRAAPVRRISKTRWRLPLGPAHLPQFLQLVSRSSQGSRPAYGTFELKRPGLSLGGRTVPVELSLWSFAHRATSARAVIEGADAVTAAQQAASRLDRLVSISEAATKTAAELPAPDGFNWYAPWAARLLAVRQESLETATDGDHGAAATQVLLPSDDPLTRASQRLDEWIERCDELLSPAASEARSDMAASGNPASRWSIARIADGRHVYGVAEGGAPQLTVHLVPQTATPRQMQIAALLAVVSGALATILLMRQPAAADLFCRWPHAVVFLIGLAYWAWLWPSWLGLLVAAGALLASLHPGLPGRSMPVEGSTVLRMESSV